MKIAFLVTRLTDPSVRYRVLQYIPFIRSNGVIAEVYIIPGSFMERMSLFRKLRSFDTVFLHRKLFNIIGWHILRKNSRHLIYDFDDAIMFRDSKNIKQSSRRRMNSFIRTVKNADLVIAGNEYLKGFSVGANPKTSVIPTSVDMQRYTEKPGSASSDSITLGWIGSQSTLFYLEKMKSVWDMISDLHPAVRLKIVSNKFFDCDKMPVIKKTWRYEEEIDDLHSFDIGLMPLTDDPWSRGKCGFKLLQYMAAGVPAVCSPVGINTEIVVDGKNGFHARSPEEWVEKISLLINNKDLRLQLGKRARETVLRSFSAESSGNKLISLLKTSRG